MAVIETVSIGSLAQGAAPPGYTHTRSTTGLYIDSDGLLKSAAVNTPRRQWDSANRRWGYVGEPGRTNLLLRSEEFDNASWAKTRVLAFGSGSVANATTAPDGASTADKVVEDTTASNDHYVQQNYTKAASSIAYSLSVYVKAAERYRVYVVAYGNGFGNRADARFIVTSGTVATAAAATGSFTSASATIESCGSGWYRCTLNFTTDTHTAVSCRVALDNGSTDAYTGDGVSGIYLWGAQLEAGPYPTSYIPTTTVAVSRGADLLTRALTAGEGTALSAQGTMVVEFSFLGKVPAPGDADRMAVCIDDGTTSNRQWTGASATTDRIYHVTRTGGSNVATPSATRTIATGAVIKAASRFATNDVNVSANAAIGTTDPTAAMPTVTTIAIGSASNGNAPIAGLVYGWTIYDDAKTDAELQALTLPTVSRNSGSLRLGLGLGL